VHLLILFFWPIVSLPALNFELSGAAGNNKKAISNLKWAVDG
jgi:hypothetical protein